MNYTKQTTPSFSATRSRFCLGFALSATTFFALIGIPCAAVAASEPKSEAQAPSESDDSNEIIFDRVTIVGAEDQPLLGSAHSISNIDLEEQGHSDIQRILRQIPGLAIQEEDGLGLRPNIGLRGTGVERSQKITLLEDGVLIAPAPYTAPAAYYFPTAVRMEGVEIRKGSVAIAHGPYTTGGAINLLSRSVPGQFGGSLDVEAGEHETRSFEGFLGNSKDRYGWLLNLVRLETAGFKDLDGPESDTGTEIEDGVAKFRINSAAESRRQQQLELKLGATAQLGRETYLGLTQNDFDATPYRRYAASAKDTIDADHEQFQLRYFIRPSANTDAITTAYRNDFARDWFKNESVFGVSNGTVLASPELFSDELGVLRGDVDSPKDALTLRHNQREYRSEGIQTLFTVSPWANRETSWAQDWQLGLRYHEDSEDRLQNDELFRMVDSTLERTSVGAAGSQSNRVSEARATSLFVQDTLRNDRWTLRLGVRYEGIEYQRRDYSRQDPSRILGPTRLRENEVDVLIPGLGLSYSLSQRNSLFVGVHKGFSPPGAGSNPATRAETSINYEFGYRRVGPAISGDAVLFFSDYENLLGAETLSGGGSTIGELFNGGEVSVAGLELSARGTISDAPKRRFPWQFAYTFTDAEFNSSFESSFADWAPRVEVGDHLPYLPEHQIFASLGFVVGPFSSFLSTRWSDQARSKAGQGSIPGDEIIPAHTVLDLSTHWRISDRWQVFAKAKNLLDEAYLASRRPYGLRPGLDRTVSLGLNFDF